MKLYFDSLTTLKVIHAESPIVIFLGTYGICECIRVVYMFYKYHCVYSALLYACNLIVQFSSIIAFYCFISMN